MFYQLKTPINNDKKKQHVPLENKQNKVGKKYKI